VTKTMEAIYENGLLELSEPIPLQGRARVRVAIELPDASPDLAQVTSPPSAGAESKRQGVLRRRLSKMSPENHALYEKVAALREKIGPLDLDVVEVLRELRNDA